MSDSNMVGAIIMLMPSSKQPINQLDLILGMEGIRKISLTAGMSRSERPKCSVLRALLPGTWTQKSANALVPFSMENLALLPSPPSASSLNPVQLADSDELAAIFY
jgi:hypothetical protein